MSHRTFTPWFERALALVLPAILAVIAAPMLFRGEGTAQAPPSAPRLIAALVTLRTAFRWRGFVMALVLGIVVVDAAQWVLQGR